MNTEGWKRLDRMLHIIKLFQVPGGRFRTREIAEKLEVNEDTANKYLRDLSTTGLLPIDKDGHYWFLPERTILPQLDISLSYPEAVALYLAGRLLAQTQDEQNWHVSMALKKLVDALPTALRERQELLRALLYFDEEQRVDKSQVFFALASGWVLQRRVRLYYEPPQSRSFECYFDPYLLEPSAIGRTIYALGYSSIGENLRTYKLERIARAELTSESFTIPDNFDGAAKLRQAWTVMYGDEEPVKVRLRFHERVAKRVRETKWHPTEEVMTTRDGCVWSALIGDTLEIEPWIRGWGSDCEVLEPPALRESVIQHVRRSMQMYGLALPEVHNPGTFNPNLFRKKE
ncbi:DNA-binding transcriptional regulator [Ktedonobacter sp. SOSP1-85]|uniref:helix-turn-helix transcriptional regulator n=1 Tax=Ktedonobacter sp. SOSP1-85 TaxID=2778367 RepID=UPI001916788C|nr:WYL domain-containing protein [Ktedonobacter sp. SOSP1-85]GHO77468.1 DNA-binding transcriptional regulator [Ktedonobacter sp. SOSP1-85]